MKIVFTGGGTGGHIFPIIAIIREMKKLSKGAPFSLFFIGAKDDYSLTLLSGEGIKIKNIIAGKFRRYFSFKNFLDFFKIVIGIIQALFYLFFLSPDIVFSKGGYGSFPVTFAARILHIPIFLHESDIVPGLATKMESKWAEEIFISFDKTQFFPKEKIILVGNPTRTEILEGSKEKAKKIFNLTEEKPLILILGGSQGAQKINDTILEILLELIRNFEIIHSTGEKNFNQVRSEAEVVISSADLKYYHPFPFLNEEYLKNALAAADLIISRAGAGSIFEIAAVGKPSILIPLSSSASNHQIENAYAYIKNGAGLVIEEENFKPHFFLERINSLFLRAQVLEKMAQQAKIFSKPKAAKIIASYLLEYLNL
ncbi:undecaprenyldiphospho-muramoylpentapeptide beta-N-acetylglucosaminyltransferase [bacterium (Candidatus Gribaldobacteria) CG07_land_8_20_14_0_80_33_18]|uniref:UDP-N-acetylglucosamine--N-acetylmuramyl-(pentapeptide) pyrophosphoryl-undecaprenol N-acetylglucosamine transferase n=1 Tax=bacterium (Candidatus Gribaldobacteria) CG07_land_8_20_14_0_80_33_18 TaxID=2014272 RepID=A0A2M6Z314_9BACT|nr:MAG: undecaprenyldiphospho-muramoylpentapeptide beta-N-acetylglucosaminyltransferase [bacterium (Candidatus Gribaldobacteria) CG07_land_8_20_14_0_80_33_18]